MAKKKTSDKDLKSEAVKTAIAQIQKQYGEGAIMRLGGQAGHVKVEVIPTGSIALDLALGVGGVPRGRIVEIFGPEASGKTTVALSIVAQAQKQGGTAAFIDAEHALDPIWARTIGVDLDDLLISQPDTGEQALEIVETLVRSGAVDIIVVDSVAALVPRAEIEGEMGDSIIGVQARLMSQAMRKLTGAISKSKTVLIFTNQLREKIGIMFGNPEVTPGGRALKFYSSIRLDTRKIDNIKDSTGTLIGTRHRVKVVKNKVAPPFRLAELDIMGKTGISAEAGLLDVGVDLGIISKAGSFFKLDGQVLGQGREAVKHLLADDANLAQQISDQIWQQIRDDQKDDDDRPASDSPGDKQADDKEGE
jgi:recombination protein RecA